MPEQDDYGRRSAGPTAEPTIRLDGYQRLVEIGRGGFAVVYQAWQPAFTRHVAVKVIATVLDAGTLKRFERECLAAGALSGHPNIVTVYELGRTEDGRPYIVMEFLEAGSVADHLSNQGPMDWRDVIDAGVKLAGALEAAHRAGVLHRDIKPENVLLSRFGEPKLGDFGIASVAGRTETRSGSVTASVAHAPPEVLGGKRPSVATDVYSLASTLYMLLAGSPAFYHPDDETILPLIARVASAPVPDLRARDVPEALCALIERGMSKDPDERPASAVEFGRLLQQLQADAGLPVTRLPLEGEPVPQPSRTTSSTDDSSTRVVTPAAPAADRSPSHRRRWTLGAATAVVIGIAVAVGVALSQSGNPSGDGAAAPTTVSTVPALLQDDFSSRNSGWAEGDNDEVKLVYRGGRYRFQVKKAKRRQSSDTELAGSAFRPELIELGDVAVEVTAFPDPESDASYGVSCRQPLHTANGYVALVNPHGGWRMLRYDDAGEHLLGQGEAPAPGAATDQTRLRLECRGPAGGPVTLRLFVDDRLVAERNDSAGLAPGAAGLVVETETSATEVAFDDLVVRPL